MGPGRCRWVGAASEPAAASEAAAASRQPSPEGRGSDAACGAMQLMQLQQQHRRARSVQGFVLTPRELQQQVIADEPVQLVEGP